MNTQPARPQKTQGIRRRELLKSSLTAGVTLSAWPLHSPRRSGGGSWTTQRGGILRAWALIRPTLIHISRPTPRPMPP
jgi:hypothetical protein